MIDLEAVAKTETGSWFDRLVAVLIGCVALLATILAIIQVAGSGQESRAQMSAARLIAQIDARNTSSTELLRLQVQAAQRGAHLGALGGTRGIAALASGDELELAQADAQLAAAQRLIDLAPVLGQPTEDGPLDGYAREMLTATIADVQALAVEQARQADVAEAAGHRVGMSVLGLSLAALVGVLAGLAGIFGDSRAGRLTLVTGSGAAVLCLGALLLALT